MRKACAIGRPFLLLEESVPFLDISTAQCQGYIRIRHLAALALLISRPVTGSRFRTDSES